MKISDKSPRMTAEDVAVLKAMFQEREGAVEVMRKIFLPALTADNPIHTNSDMWTGNYLTLEGLTPEQKVMAVEAHVKLVKHVEGAFAVIQALVGEAGETAEQTLARLQKNSAK